MNKNQERGDFSQRGYMKSASFLILLPLLTALTACNQEQATDSRTSVQKPKPFNGNFGGEVAPGSTNYLDYKNGFRDVKFGQHTQDIKGLVLVEEYKIKGNILATYTNTYDNLSLNGNPLTMIEYFFLNNELVVIGIHWDQKYTNTISFNYPNVPAELGVKGYKFPLPFPTMLDRFLKNLYGDPTQTETKDTKSKTDDEVTSRMITTTGIGNKVGLAFQEWQFAGIYPDWPASTSGHIQISGREHADKIAELIQLIEPTEAARQKDGL
jgi:hypothetical protein